MKLILKSFALLSFLFLLFNSSLSAQQLPFQGKLLELGVPVDGTRTFEFSISAIGWTETHSGVPVTQGLYSVVLGSITPLPADIFSAQDSRTLNISVNSVAISPVQIYAAVSSPNLTLTIDNAAVNRDAEVTTLTGVGAANQVYRSIVGISSLQNGVQSGVTGEGISSSTSTNNTYGVFARSTGQSITGQHRAIYGEAISPSGSAANQYGFFGSASGDGTGSHFGIFATAQGLHDNFGGLLTANGLGKYNAGVRGFASGEGNGDTGFETGSYNNGVQGYARGNNWGNTGVYGWAYNDPQTGTGIGVDNHGVVGRSEVNDNTTTINNVGVRGEAKGPGINKGVVGVAFNGEENWAGYFEGDLRVTGDLIVDGTGGSSLPSNITLNANGLSITDESALDDRIGSISNFAVQHRGPDGEINSWLGNNFNDGGSAFENRGALFLWADTDERDNINGGVDTRRVDLTVSDDGFGKSVGKFSLGGPVSGLVTSRRFIEMSATSDEGDFYNGQIFVSGHSTLNTVIGAKSFEGATGYDNPFLGMIGSINTDYLSYLEVINDGSSNEYGNLLLQSTYTNAGNARINPTEISLSDDLGQKFYAAKDINENGTLTLGSDQSDRSIRMYANLESDGRSHIALDGQSGRYVYLWGNGKIENNKAWIVEDWGTTTNQGAIQLFDASDLEMVTLAANDDGSTETYGYLRLQDNENSAELSLFGRGLIVMNNSLGDQVFNLNNQGQANFGDYFGTPATGVFVDGGNGNVSATGSIEADILISSDGLVQTSDSRLKTNILPLNNSLSNIIKIRGVSYQWIDPTKSQDNQIGVIAQEVEAIYPEFVHTDDKGMKSVNYSQMVAVLIEAMKEMNGKIESLETENASLKASISEMDGLKLQMKNLEGMMKKLAGESPSSTISNAQQK